MNTEKQQSGMPCEEEKISVIVPVYNCEAFVAQAINSVLDQSYSNWELILIDDGSADHSAQICETYASRDNRISLLCKKNGGASSARNMGLDHASGTYVMFLDADDMLMPDALKTLAGYAEGVDLVVFGLHMTDGSEKIVSDVVVCYNSVADTAENAYACFYTSFYSSPCNKLYRREKIANRFDETIFSGEDLLFNLSFFETCGKIRAIPQVLYIYRVETANSLSKNLFLNSDQSLCLMFNRMLAVVGDTPEVRRCVSRFLVDMLLTCTVRLMNSSRSFKEKYRVLKAWSRNPVIRDKRINTRALKNDKHRFFLLLYQTRMLLAIMLLCR